MIRPICWVQKLPDKVKREVRVTFFSGGIKWQFKRSDEESWNYDLEPSLEDWDELYDLVHNRYQRRSASQKDLDLTTRLRNNARSKAGAKP
jgi:hypothetical protein